jgi:hypothetical protein
MIWTESLIFLANEVTVTFLLTVYIIYNTLDKLVRENTLGFR